MADGHALTSAPPATATSDWLEQSGLMSLLGVAATVHFSIAAAQTLLAVALVCWAALVVTRHERVEAPRLFWPLVAFGAMTLVSAAFSPDPRASFADSK